VHHVTAKGVMDPKLQRRVQRYGWDKAAAWYEQSWRRQLAPAQTALLALATLRAGDRVVDVACGTGLVTFGAADIVGPMGTVLGVDLSEAMVMHARARARERRLDSVLFQRMDAEQNLMTPETYLDYHATTPVDRRVLDAMWPYFLEHFGNPASRSHAAGREAYRAVETARDQIATFIGARAQDITFTGGATESNNLALKGVVRAHRSGRRSRIVTVVTEHPSVLDTCDALEREGCEITRLAVGPDGIIDLDDLRRALETPTLLVSIMVANGEIGVLQPIAHIAAIVHAAGALLHSDASQAAGKVPLNAQALGVDLMVFTAHKMYGPKGIGALYVHPHVGRLEPVLHGGGHERGLRSGTLNVPAIVGFGVRRGRCDGGGRPGGGASRRASRSAPRRPAEDHSGPAHQRLDGRTPAAQPAREHGGGGCEDAGTGPRRSRSLDRSACSSGDAGPSYVLSALGLPDDLARASIRFGLGRWTTSSTINHAIDRVASAVLKPRSVEAQLRP
jgi:cysteine desulfurase